MHNTYFFAGREQELHDLIDHPAGRDLDDPACAGEDPATYHPEEGRPNELSLLRCRDCLARLACLALALRVEDPDARAGWYGGLGPADRDEAAMILQLETRPSSLPDRATEATRLRAEGRTVNEIASRFACSRRTVQRYLRAAVA